jgi:hypothetical protein
LHTRISTPPQRLERPCDKLLKIGVDRDIARRRDGFEMLRNQLVRNIVAFLRLIAADDHASAGACKFGHYRLANAPRRPGHNRARPNNIAVLVPYGLG